MENRLITPQKTTSLIICGRFDHFVVEITRRSSYLSLQRVNAHLPRVDLDGKKTLGNVGKQSGECFKALIRR
jgi:hypothetical protein